MLSEDLNVAHVRSLGPQQQNCLSSSAHIEQRKKVDRGYRLFTSIHLVPFAVGGEQSTDSCTHPSKNRGSNCHTRAPADDRISPTTCRCPKHSAGTGANSEAD